MKAVRIVDMPWRVGRKLGRTVYAQRGPVPSDADVLLGMMDSAALAAFVVSTHNCSGGYDICESCSKVLQDEQRFCDVEGCVFCADCWASLVEDEA